MFLQCLCFPQRIVNKRHSTSECQRQQIYRKNDTESQRAELLRVSRNTRERHKQRCRERRVIKTEYKFCSLSLSLPFFFSAFIFSKFLLLSFRLSFVVHICKSKPHQGDFTSESLTCVKAPVFSSV